MPRVRAKKTLTPVKKAPVVPAPKPSSSKGPPQLGDGRRRMRVESSIASDVRQIQKSLVDTRKTAKRSIKKEISVAEFVEEEVSVEVAGRKLMLNKRRGSEEDELRPIRSRKPNQRYTDLISEKKETKHRQRNTGALAINKSIAIAPIRKVKPPPVRKPPKNVRSITMKSSKVIRKRQRSPSLDPDDDDEFEEDPMPMSYMNDDEETEFIEIQESEAPPMIHHPRMERRRGALIPTKEESEINRYASKSVVVTTRVMVDTRPPSDQSDYGMGLGSVVVDEEDEEDVDLETLGDDFMSPPDPQFPQLQGITVTGTAPPVEAPSRVFMKLKAPEFKRQTRHKPCFRPGDIYNNEYLDQYYSPQLHVGGRGRFGVIGNGPPPPAMIIEKPEDFTYIPPEIVSDHCYGKSQPHRHHASHHVVEQSGFGRTGRLPPPHLLPTAIIQRKPQIVYPRNIYRRSPSPPSYREATGSGLPAAAFVVTDSGLEAYEGMEVAFADVSSEGSAGSTLAGVNILGHGQVPMLGVDKLPANILEEMDDPELGEASIDIH